MKKLIQLIKTVTGSSTAAKSAESDKTFASLGLREELCRAVADDGYATPTPIQLAAIPEVASGRDLLGCAQTGTGKTAAFALPMLHRLANTPAKSRGVRALILTPTRELAIQIGDSFKSYGRHLKLRSTVVYGGVGLEPQKKLLRQGIDILVATPGRLLDLHGQGFGDFTNLEIFVLDEADRMLDMGFIHDVKKIIRLLPKERQTLLFSATMPKDIQDLSMSVLRNPAKVEVTPVSSTAELIAQSVYFVDRPSKRHLLLHVINEEKVTRALVFTRTKHVANRVAEFLCEESIKAEAIHGNKSQSARQRALENFKAGKTRILVASDIASRGIDIDMVSHVINYDVPNVPETYVHRIGRTGRAEASGIAISFCDKEEVAYIRDIERLTQRKIPVVDEHPFPSTGEGYDPNQPTRNGRGGGGGRRGGGGGGGGRGPRSSSSSRGSGGGQSRQGPGRPSSGNRGR